MGRTGRRRMQRLKDCKNPIKLCSQDETIHLTQWMTRQGCVLPPNMTPAIFEDTGRGVLTSKAIKSNSLLIDIPRHLLISVETVYNSEIGNLFINAPKDQYFSVHQILTTFLIWERHLGDKSKWQPYINTLPKDFSTALFLTPTEHDLLPCYLQETVVQLKKEMLMEYEQVVALINKWGHNCLTCSHGSLVEDIFTNEAYFWGWSVVNTRCVYLRPKPVTMQLRSANDLALAPYLDLFNHSCKAEVAVLETETSYQLYTRIAFPSYSQVFINYGSRPNYKLYIDYGFICPGNPLDFVLISPGEVEKAVQIKYPTGTRNYFNKRVEFIKKHQFTENLEFYATYMSFNLKAIIHVLTVNDFNMAKVLMNIFTGCYSSEDEKEIAQVGLSLLEKIIGRHQGYNTRLNLFDGHSKSVTNLKLLVMEHLRVLESCSKVLSDKYAANT